ncbi:hypothetical protein ABEB36_009687 [Hypothenemus hampei]|uniref:G-protein coupled receptors family 1 profile domain-containing protein n=1 Tax=Hypothenemus hampei TaxID=57062 RepID=A0ABD1EHH5_HYPHA
MNDSQSLFKSATNATYDYQTRELNVTYMICEIVVAILAVVGNALVIYVFQKEKRLRRRTNYYIVSLAAADFLVGFLGIPFAIMSSIGLPNNLYACLFTVSLLVVLCTISIFCLLAVSVDRYWAILHPMGYSRNVRTKTALVIISICWFAGSLVGFLPLIGWHQGKSDNVDCFFLNVMDYHYLVFLYFGTIITPALLLAAFYAHIYRVILKQLRQIVVMHPDKATAGKSKNKNLPSTGGMIRMLGVQQRNEVKATQNLSIIVLFFMICWIPLYTINCLIAFYKDFNVNSTFMLSCIILSHLNSAGNPLLYAYHLRDFQAALKAFFCNLFGVQQQQQQQHMTIKYSTVYKGSLKSTNDYKLNRKGQLDVKETENIIFNILEDSGRDSASSQDSLKDEKEFLMLRPATPFRSHNISIESNKNFVDSDKEVKSHNTFHSKSSSQVFTIKCNNEVQRDNSYFLGNRLSPCKVVQGLLKNKKPLNRSSSDSDFFTKFNEVVVDYYSVPI